MRINWDTLDDCEDILAVVDGKHVRSDAFTRDRLFVRSLERLPWHYVTALWGIDAIKELYTPENTSRIWPKERRRHFDFALAVLRREPLPAAGWVLSIISRSGTDFFLTGGTALSRGYYHHAYPLYRTKTRESDCN